MLQRASDRSWKPLWAALRGQNLYLFKDRSNVVGAHLYPERKRDSRRPEDLCLSVCSEIRKLVRLDTILSFVSNLQ